VHDIAVVFGLFAAVAAFVPLADKLAVPYPIFLVIGGLLLSFVPGLPRIVLRPDLVFLLFLPPLLYWDAFRTSWRDFQANLRPIGTLAVGLVVFTTCGVAMVAHVAVHGLSWPLAFVLGAVVSSTDAVAASSIAKTLGLPTRVVSILEGESLMNDASSLVVYATALTAVTDGSFSLPGAVGRFVLVSAGGIAIGLSAGYLVGVLRGYMEDPLTESTVSLLTPFAAYLPADLLGASGVLAVVSCGLYLGRLSSEIASSRTRLQTESVWSLLSFLLNGLAFILVGLQLHGILVDLAPASYWSLIREMVSVSAAVIVVRMLWVFAAAWLPRLLPFLASEGGGASSWRETAIISWAGMRGVVALATALALPTIAAGRPFQQRELLIALTFAVILTTLVLQGLSLPLLIRRLGVVDDGTAVREETLARFQAARAALEHLDGLIEHDRLDSAVAAGLRKTYAKRVEHLAAHLDGTATQWHGVRPRNIRDAKRELIDVERRTIIDMRNNNDINDAVLRRIQRELDLDDVRLGGGLHEAEEGQAGA
jgi:monovalent cation/hydrogen antiporter